MGTFYGRSSPQRYRKGKNLAVWLHRILVLTVELIHTFRKNLREKRVLPHILKKLWTVLGPKTSKTHENSYSSSKVRRDTLPSHYLEKISFLSHRLADMCQ